MLRQPNHLRKHRKRWGLTQSELGELLGVSKSVISRYESGRPLPMEQLIACEIIFGIGTEDGAMKLLLAVEDGLSRRALTVHNRLEGRDDPASRKKLRLLAAIPSRMHQIDQ